MVSAEDLKHSVHQAHYLQNIAQHHYLLTSVRLRQVNATEFLRALCLYSPWMTIAISSLLHYCTSIGGSSVESMAIFSALTSRPHGLEELQVMGNTEVRDERKRVCFFLSPLLVSDIPV